MERPNNTAVHCLENTGLSRTYIIEGADSLMAVDVGSLGAAKDTVSYIRRHLKRDMGELSRIAATHFHIDHIGGIGSLLTMCGPATKVLFNYRVKDYLSGKKKISLIKNWFTGLVPASLVSLCRVRRLSHFAFMSGAGIPVPAMRRYVKLPFEGERIIYFGRENARRFKLGFDSWEVIDTPGHTEDSVSLYNEPTGELICGDFILNIRRNGGGMLNRFHWDGGRIKESFSYVTRTLAPRHVYPGHGDVIRDENNALRNVKEL
ncbi:MAG: MBL fold metallo-hydrolase [Deltaproteobacteria bacterium]|nr:MBL fold metallo-hydrolase [Deltaproteobacteria bacterium]MBN2686881.1 MBL fold metallo-hydrolase [Deltaproteobacteria bacterium]